jgi:hypothetical protein
MVRWLWVARLETMEKMAQHKAGFNSVFSVPGKPAWSGARKANRSDK